MLAPLLVNSLVSSPLKLTIAISSIIIYRHRFWLTVRGAWYYYNLRITTCCAKISAVQSSTMIRSMVTTPLHGKGNMPLRSIVTKSCFSITHRRPSGPKFSLPILRRQYRRNKNPRKRDWRYVYSPNSTACVSLPRCLSPTKLSPLMSGPMIPSKTSRPKSKTN